jgi:eukaryotic-like serine/threonine-protein kinase
MGFVELCFRRDGRFLRWSARKRLHEQYRSDARFRSMFMDEARLAGLVHHPNVVGVSDVGEDEQGPFLIMDYVEGVSLAHAIRETAKAGQSIPMQVAVRICREVAMGLHAAHEVRSEDGTVLHLVHRDVSPQNILIGFDGTVRVTDFGIAKALGNVSHTNTGVLKGNMGYLSPEQLRFESPDRRSDFFSLGVTLFELLSGTRLYPNTDGFDGTRRILSEPPPDIGELRSDVPPELVELLFEMLAKDRDSRPSNALDIATRLEGILAPLIADEGSVTVADYMDQQFAVERQQHRAFLAEHLRRLEAAGPITWGSIPAVPENPPAAATRRAARSRAPLGWLLAAAASAAVVGIAVAEWHHGPFLTPDRHVAADPVARPGSERPSQKDVVAPAVPVAIWSTAGSSGHRDADAPAVVAAGAGRGYVKRHAPRPRRHARADIARRPALTPSPPPRNLSVPLFTQWR